MFPSASTVKLMSVAWGLVPVQVPTKPAGTGASLWVSVVAWLDLFDSDAALLLVPPWASFPAVTWFFEELASGALASFWPWKSFEASVLAFLADCFSDVCVLADDFTTLEVEVVDDAAVSFSDLEPHPPRAIETATDNKTSEQTRITFLFIFINLFSICLLYLFCYKNQVFCVIFVTFM